MSNGSFSLEGFDELGELLKAIPDEFDTPILKKSFLAAAEIPRKEASMLAPVDTGRLSEMIGRAAGAKGDDVFVKVGPIRLGAKAIERNLKKAQEKKARGKAGGTVLTSWAYYATWVEHGTRHMKAQPFLRPAFDKTKEKFVSEVGNQVGERIDKQFNLHLRKH